MPFGVFMHFMYNFTVGKVCTAYEVGSVRMGVWSNG